MQYTQWYALISNTSFIVAAVCATVTCDGGELPPLASRSILSIDRGPRVVRMISATACSAASRPFEATESGPVPVPGEQFCEQAQCITDARLLHCTCSPIEMKTLEPPWKRAVPCRPRCCRFALSCHARALCSLSARVCLLAALQRLAMLATNPNGEGAAHYSIRSVKSCELCTDCRNKMFRSLALTYRQIF